MSGPPEQWSSRAVTTVPVRSGVPRSPEQWPGGGMESSSLHQQAPLSPPPSPHGSPVHCFRRSVIVSVQHTPARAPGSPGPPRTGALPRPSAQPPLEDLSYYSPGSGRRFPLSPCEQGVERDAPHPQQQRVQVVRPLGHPEEDTLPDSAPEGWEDPEDAVMMEYPHQNMYLGASSGASPQEQRERQLKQFAAMQNSSHHKHSEELYSEVPEPVPDYQDEDSNEFPPPPPPIAPDNNPSPTSPSPGDASSTTIIGVGNGAMSSPEEEGELIPPRKLVNPCVASRERQALHRELLLNYKLGKNVLQKPELNQVLAKRKETQKRKEWEEMKATKRTSLELRLEEQANKLKEKEESNKMKTIEEDNTKAPEFVQMHRRITHKTPTSPPT